VEWHRIEASKTIIEYKSLLAEDIRSLASYLSIKEQDSWRRELIERIMIVPGQGDLIACR